MRGISLYIEPPSYYQRAKIKAMCVVVFAYAKGRFSNDPAQMIILKMVIP